MSRIKASPATTAGVQVGNDAMPEAANPHSWLHLTGSDAPPSADRFMFGVLRPVYRDWVNSAVAFGTRKLRPVVPAGNDDEAITAARAEVLLPTGADDRFADPWTVLRSCDQRRPPGLNTVLTYVTISEPNTARLHEQWARSHEWARRDIVDRYGTPVLMVQHAPHHMASRNPPHLHLLILGPRRLTSLGWADKVPDLSHDRGRDLLLRSWRTHVGSE